MLKNEKKLHFFTILFGQFKKKQYLCSRFREKHATVAQLVEQRIRNAWVAGSSPASGSKWKNRPRDGSFILPSVHRTRTVSYGVPEDFNPWGEGGVASN